MNQRSAPRDSTERVSAVKTFAGESPRGPGPHQFKMGMNAPGIDNRQFTFNTLRWLNGVRE